MTRPRIELAIDELLLHGFAAADQNEIAAAAQAELGRLLTDHGLPGFSAADGGSAPTRVNLGDRIAGGSLSLSAHGHPQRIGTQVGRAIYGTLSPPSATPDSGNRRTR